MPVPRQCGYPSAVKTGALVGSACLEKHVNQLRVSADAQRSRLADRAQGIDADASGHHKNVSVLKRLEPIQLACLQDGVEVDGDLLPRALEEGALQVSVRGTPAAKRDRIEDCGALAKLIRAGILKLSKKAHLLAGPLRHEQDVALLQGQVA